MNVNMYFDRWSNEVSLKIEREFSNINDAQAFVTRVNEVKEAMPEPKIKYREEKGQMRFAEQYFINSDPIIKNAVLGAGQNGTNKIDAIKVHRFMTGSGLKEAKDIVEDWFAEPQIKDILPKTIKPKLGYPLPEFSYVKCVNGGFPGFYDRGSVFFTNQNGRIIIDGTEFSGDAGEWIVINEDGEPI